MSDNIQFKDGNGVAYTLRTKDLSGSGLQAFYSMVVTAVPTVLTGNQTIALSTSSDATFTVPSGATHALSTVDGGSGDARFWEDGSSPSTTAGLDIPSGSGAEFTNLANVKVRSTTGTPNLQASYRKYS